MQNNFFQRFMNALKDPILRKRIGFTVLALVIFRVLATIPIPGVNAASLNTLLNGNQFFSLFNVFSGGGLSNLSIVMLGVGPFITASIIIQLLTMVFPKWKSLLQEEGEAGRLKLSQYSRYIAVPLSFISAIGFISLLQSQTVLPSLGWGALLVNASIITGGSILLMWIGELISEFGIGNGVSLIIFAGIVARLPTSMSNFAAKVIGGTVSGADYPLYVTILVVAIIAIAATVFITEAERAVPVTYAKQVRGNKVYGGASTYIPLRLNQTGVMPIIFALSLIIVPQMIASPLSKVANTTVASLASSVLAFFNNQLYYGIIYFVLVVAFTYFYTTVTFDPVMMSEDLQRKGAFIPGVRPGEHTRDYLGNIVTRITLVGALFLGIIAVLPVIVQAANSGDKTLTVGGTALLIVVTVVLDLLKKIDAQVAMREY